MDHYQDLMTAFDYVAAVSWFIGKMIYILGWLIGSGSKLTKPIISMSSSFLILVACNLLKPVNLFPT